MPQIVMCQTAERAIGLPLRPDVHNAAECDQSADSGRARQPVFRSRPIQPSSFCGRRRGALGGCRLGRSHVPKRYPARSNGERCCSGGLLSQEWPLQSADRKGRMVGSTAFSASHRRQCRQSVRSAASAQGNLSFSSASLNPSLFRGGAHPAEGLTVLDSGESGWPCGTR